jgi:hypothetical protein
VHSDGSDEVRLFAPAIPCLAAYTLIIAMAAPTFLLPMAIIGIPPASGICTLLMHRQDLIHFRSVSVFTRFCHDRD